MPGEEAAVIVVQLAWSESGMCDSKAASSVPGLCGISEICGVIATLEGTELERGLPAEVGAGCDAVGEGVGEGLPIFRTISATIATTTIAATTPAATRRLRDGPCSSGCGGMLDEGEVGRGAPRGFCGSNDTTAIVVEARCAVRAY